MKGVCTMVEEIKTILEKLQKMTVEELASYDVKLEDGIHQDYIKAYDLLFHRTSKAMDALSPWERMCYYKVSGTTGTDCDVALFTVVVYYLAFGLKKKEWKINEHKGGYHLEKLGERWELRGDTMNSYATTVRGYIRDIWMQSRKRIESDNMTKMRRQEIIITPDSGKWAVNSKFEKNCWEDVILRNYGYFQDVLPCAGFEYIRQNHTIGNFIPVPFVEGGGQFNSPRGYDGLSYDFWDLALMCIYNYYFSIKDLTYNLKWLLSNDQNVNLCKKWLDSFGSSASGWDAFVEQNFMQDFVNSEQGHYGMPKELWKGHFEGTVMPKEEKHYNEFFTNASAWIAARGIRIAIQIKDALSTLVEEMVYGK